MKLFKALLQARRHNAAAHLRRRTFKLCNKVNEASLALDNMEPSLVQLDNAVRLLAAHDAGCWCGSAALILHQRLQLLGYNSAVVDFGFPGTPDTHISVVVDLGNGIWELQDPYFNVTSLPLDTGADEPGFVIPESEFESNDFEQLCISRSPDFTAYQAQPVKSLSQNFAFRITFTLAEFFRLRSAAGSRPAGKPVDDLNDLLRRPFRAVTETEFTAAVLDRLR